jgi:hypothetical protein
MKVESALKPLLDLMSIILFEACSTENSKEKAGRLIPLMDLKSCFANRSLPLFF